MEPNGIDNKMSSEIERRFRLNEVITTIKNRIRWEQSEKFLPHTFEEKIESKGKVDAYVDVLGIINKEMTMELPYDKAMLLENEIKQYRDNVMDEVIDIEQYRGTRDYDRMFVLKKKIASILEQTIYNSFELGYKFGNESCDV
jgi:hypothetical protein